MNYKEDNFYNNLNWLPYSALGIGNAVNMPTGDKVRDFVEWQMFDRGITHGSTLDKAIKTLPNTPEREMYYDKIKDVYDRYTKYKDYKTGKALKGVVAGAKKAIPWVAITDMLFSQSANPAY